jgi:uncharacterized protein (DUF983 family)
MTEILFTTTSIAFFVLLGYSVEQLAETRVAWLDIVITKHMVTHPSMRTLQVIKPSFILRLVVDT